MFKPMLSATLVNPETLQYPVVVSPKLDGLRCVIRGGVALSRNLKPFRNKFVQDQLRGLPDGLDGELIVGLPNEGHVLNRTQSGIMSADGNPDFTYWVFDSFSDPRGFLPRYDSLKAINHYRVAAVPHYEARTATEFYSYEDAFLRTGYEGVMARHMFGAYKFGRSTLNEGLLMKWKRFTDGEAMVIDLYEGVHNENELTRSATGAAQRSHHQENKVPASCIGTIVGKNLATGEVMQISPGRMTYNMRAHYWTFREQLLGKIVKFKSFEYGKKDNARFATFQAFRDPMDFSA